MIDGFLRQNTSGLIRFFGKFISSDDGITPAEDLGDIDNSDILLYRPDVIVSDNPVNGAFHMSTGDYYIEFDAADVDLCGVLTLTCKIEGALFVCGTYLVLPPGLYDAYVGVTANKEYLEAAVKATNYFNRIF